MEKFINDLCTSYTHRKTQENSDFFPLKVVIDTTFKLFKQRRTGKKKRNKYI